MVRLALIAVCISSFIPIQVMAIELSEVAWMGSTNSATHEWIELHTKETIDVTGWSISDGNNLQIDLTGTISAGDFAVLERTSDDSAPGPAWHIYTGSLVNTGATLSLYDATGAVVDRVVGGEGWQLIGGDNVTKATAQLSTNGWITASPTPGAKSSGTPQTTADTTDEDAVDEEDTPDTTATKSSRSAASTESIQLTLPGITLKLAAAGPKTTYVNQPVEFTVTPSGVGSTIANSLNYTWSFGDTNTAMGQTVKHAYSHPGNYVVVVEAIYKRQVQRTRHEIIVLPVSLTLREHASGDFAIQNNSQTEIDLAGYRLVGSKSFTIPDYTILLPRSEIIVAREKFLAAPVAQMIALYDHAKQPAAVHYPGQLASRTTTAVASQPPVRQATPSAPVVRAADASARYTFATTNVANAAEPDLPGDTPPPVGFLNPVNSYTQVAAAGTATLPTNWPSYALVALLLCGIMAVYLIPPSRKDYGPLE